MGGQADANKGHAFGILMALVGTLRTFGAPAPLTLGYKDFPFCQAIGHHSLTASLQAIQTSAFAHRLSFDSIHVADL